MCRSDLWSAPAVFGALTALSLGLVACDGNGWPRQVAQGGTIAGSVSVADVELGKSVDADMRVTDQTDEFLPTDLVYVSVTVKGDAPSARLTARWLFEDGRLIEETSQTVMLATNPTAEFHISQASGLPIGNYKVVVQLDGKTVAVKEFEVEKRH